MAAPRPTIDLDARQRPAGPLSRPSNPNLTASARSPRSPHTPQLGRSISSQFGSPSAYRAEQEDVITYELTPRHLSAGYAGESKPRCVIRFTPESSRRIGDYRQYDGAYERKLREFRVNEEWGSGHELYRNDIRDLDLGLVEDKLERALRKVHIDFLQLDNKPKRCILVIPSMLPIPLVELTLKVLFSHYALPPSISLLSDPVMCCVSAGLRHGLVVNIGWEETVVTAVGEYKEILQKRSVRAGKQLTREIGNTIEGSVPSEDEVKVTFAEAEDLTQRIAWCRPRTKSNNSDEATIIQLPVPGGESTEHFSILFSKLAEPVDKVLFASGYTETHHDDNELPLHTLAFQTLLVLPLDLRSLCISRVIITGSYSDIPGLKTRLLQELTHLVSTRGWDTISNYGSAKVFHTQALNDRSPNSSALKPPSSPKIPSSPLKGSPQASVATMDRVHDDINDRISQKAENAQATGRVEPVKGVVRGVETLGAWAGASLTASLRVKGTHEIEKDDFLKSGLRNAADRL